MGRAIEQEVEGRGGKGKRWERKTSRVWAQSSAKKGCGYREVPGKGGVQKGAGSRWGWAGLGTASLEFHSQSYPGLPGDPGDVADPLSLSILSEALQRRPKAVLYVTHSVLQSNRLRRHSPRWLSQ